MVLFPTPIKRRLFWIGAVIGLAAALLVAWIGLSQAQTSSSLLRITYASDSTRDSSWPRMTPNGRLIAFYSDSEFPGTSIADDQFEIWLYDTATMTFTRVTTASGNDRRSWLPDIDDDGTFIAFQSDSDFFGQGVQKDQEEIWLVNTATLTLTRITTATSTFADSHFPSLSGNGAVVAFFSTADILGEGRPLRWEIWLYDTGTMTYTRVTSASNSFRVSASPSLNQDGSRLVFYSDSDFFREGIVDNQNEIWMYEPASQQLTRLTYASGSDRGSFSPSLSADGTRVTFYSDSDFLNQGIPDEQYEIWLYDTQTMTFTRVTTASDTTRGSFSPELSADGTVVAFRSDSDLLGEGIPFDQYEIWLYDTTTLTYTRVTTASAADRDSWSPSLSRDGSRLAFNSDSDFQGEGVPFHQLEIWLRTPSVQLFLPHIQK